MFIIGYSSTDILGNSVGITYYGFDVLKENWWANIIYLPWLAINIMIIIIYHISKKGSDK